MARDSQGEVILWETQTKPPLNMCEFICRFPGCHFTCDSIKYIRHHAMMSHGAAVVFCVWCKGRKTFLRPDNLQGHVKQVHPNKRDFVNGDVLEQFAVVPELWPRTRRHVLMTEPKINEMINMWWQHENRRRKQLGLVENKMN